MIFYFSATGNNKYIAQRISSVIPQELISISECMKKSVFSFEAKPGESVGFITPTYFWGLPSIVKEFLESLRLKTNSLNYVYHIVSYGTVTGTANEVLEKKLKTFGVKLDAKFSVHMVDTWTPMFNVTEQAKDAKLLAETERDICAATELIKNKSKGDFNEHKGVMHIMSPFAQLSYESSRKTKKFTVLDSCIACGLCDKNCPTQAIEIQGRLPVWIKDKCTLCLSCVHHCPKFAIQYGKNTAKNGQYLNPHTEI